MRKEAALVFRTSENHILELIHLDEVGQGGVPYGTAVSIGFHCDADLEPTKLGRFFLPVLDIGR